MRIELAGGLDLGETFPRQQVAEGAVHEADALLELRLLMLGHRLERTLEVVEDAEYEVVDDK